MISSLGRLDAHDTPPARRGRERSRSRPLVSPRWIVAALLLLWTGAVHAQPFRLVVTEQAAPLVPNSVIGLADRLGYFAREGVDVKLVRVEQTPMAVAALMSGGADMADVSVEAALKLAARGQVNIKAVAAASTRFPYMVVAQDRVRSVRDLVGASFGIGRIGSLDHGLTMEVLRARRVDPGALKLVAIGQPDVRLLALAAGRIAATTVSVGSWSTFPSKTGLHVLVPAQDFAAAAPVIGKVLAVPGDVLNRRRDAVTGVVTALIKASRDFAADPARWAAAMRQARSDVSEADLTQLAASFKGQWSVNGGLGRDDLASTTDWLYRTSDFAGLPRVQPAAWTDTSVVDGILAELGVDRSGDPPGR